MPGIDAHLLLVGFMGSGKSTVAPWLAVALHCPCRELDQQVVERYQLSVPEIFERYGEAAFRRSESWELGRLLMDPISVIALGGGAFHPANRALLPPGIRSVWLDLPPGLAWERCRLDPNRPLARDRRRFEELFEERQADYCAAQHRIRVAEQTPRQLARQILEQLNSSRK